MIHLSTLLPSICSVLIFVFLFFYILDVLSLLTVKWYNSNLRIGPYTPKTDQSPSHELKAICLWEAPPLGFFSQQICSFINEGFCDFFTRLANDLLPKFRKLHFWVSHSLFTSLLSTRMQCSANMENFGRIWILCNSMKNLTACACFLWFPQSITTSFLLHLLYCNIFLYKKKIKW